MAVSEPLSRMVDPTDSYTQYEPEGSVTRTCRVDLVGCVFTQCSMIKSLRGFPGGPVVKTLGLYCMDCEFAPWLENSDPTFHTAQPRNLKKKLINKNRIWPLSLDTGK